VKIDHKNFINIFDYHYESKVRNVEQAMKLFPDFIIDTNRGIEYNHNAAELNKDTLTAAAIRARQLLIKACETAEVDGYCVVVPTELHELQDEGRQQNNCVGHYYNSNIICGKDFIYFIRETSNPDKSFHTCRFNVYEGKTVEDRIKNNRTSNDEKEKQIVSIVDKIIVSILEGLNKK
jgi:hypothetical protein